MGVAGHEESEEWKRFGTQNIGEKGRCRWALKTKEGKVETNNGLNKNNISAEKTKNEGGGQKKTDQITRTEQIT